MASSRLRRICRISDRDKGTGNGSSLNHACSNAAPAVTRCSGSQVNAELSSSKPQSESAVLRGCGCAAGLLAVTDGSLAMMPPVTGRLRQGRAARDAARRAQRPTRSDYRNFRGPPARGWRTPSGKVPQRMGAVESIEALSETRGPCCTWTSLLSSRSSAEMRPTTIAKDTASRGNVQDREDPVSVPW